MDMANLVSPCAHIRHRPITTLYIARPCSSSTTLTRRTCTRSLPHLLPLTSSGEGSKIGVGRYGYHHGSCGDAALPASGGDENDTPYGGGSGGGGGGGGGGNAGNSDEHNMSLLAVPSQQLQLKRKSLRLDQTLEILTARGHQIATKLLADLEKVPVFRKVMIGFLTSIPQGTVLRALGAVLENPEESTYLGDSSSSMDNLQCTSSTDPSRSVAAISSCMDVDGSHSSDDNDDDSIRPVLNSRSSVVNYTATNMGPRSSHVMRNEATIPRPMDTSSGQNALEENENKKGFLAPIISVTTILFTASLALAIATYAYPLTPKASLGPGDPWMQVITAGSTIAFVASIILACLGFRLKGRKSIQGAGFQTVKWLILLHPLVLATGTCIFLHFALKLSNAVAWLIGAISYIAILLIWAWIYYVDHPEIMEGMRNDSVEDGTFSSTV